MLIRVMFDDGRFDMVKPQTLDALLATRSVTSFKRAQGWAVVGFDAIRSPGSSQRPEGRERRTC